MIAYLRDIAARVSAWRAAELCECGHPRDWHTHHRAGSDCGTCGSCKRFRRA